MSSAGRHRMLSCMTIARNTSDQRRGVRRRLLVGAASAITGLAHRRHRERTRVGVPYRPQPLQRWEP